MHVGRRYAEPSRVAALCTTVLMGQSCYQTGIRDQELLLEDPSVSGERRNTQANQELIVLISDLLELVRLVCPEGGEFDLRSEPFQDTICLCVGGSKDIDVPSRAPSGDQLFSPIAPLRLDACPLIQPKGLCDQLKSSSVWYSLFNPCARAASNCTSGSLIISGTLSCRQDARQTDSVEPFRVAPSETRWSPRHSRPSVRP